MKNLAALLFTSDLAAGLGVDGSLRSHHSRSFVSGMKFEYTLRVCNAYPFPSAIDVYTNSAKKLNVDPMPYKSCEDFTTELHAGDRVDFKVGDTSAGTFVIQGLPNSDATLLLVVYRHDTFTNAVAFESHVFSSVSTSQVAVLDTYKSRARSNTELRIHRPQADIQTNLTESELLRMDSIVAVDVGEYKVELLDTKSNTPMSEVDVVALPREAYVVIRCGVKAEEGEDYPEELMMYPHSDRAMLGYSVRQSSVNFAMLLLAFATWMISGL